MKFLLKCLPACMALSLGLAGCGFAPGHGPSDPMFFSSSNSSAQVKGQIVLPYRAQPDRSAALPNPVNFFIGQAAQADTLITVTSSELNRIQAYVNGQPVSLQVTNLAFNGDQTVISYEIGSLPVVAANGVYLLDIRLPNGDPLVGGVLTLTPGTVNTYNLTVDTTALLDTVREILGTQPVTTLTVVRIHEIEKSREVLGRKDLIRALLLRDGHLRYAALQRIDLDGFDWDDGDGCYRADIKYKEKKNGMVQFQYKCKD